MRTRLVYVVTHPVSADALLFGQLRFMRGEGFDVTLVSSPGPELERVAAREDVRIVALPMQRSISVSRDVISLSRLTALLRTLRPHIVNASTPKAGLLGMLAAFANRIPVRVYLLRGLRLETATGALRRVLSATERTAASCATRVVCVSESLRRVAIGGGYVAENKAIVVGNGSSNGVAPERWAPDGERVRVGIQRARELGIADAEDVVGFVGRFERDKGIVDLLQAFDTVRRAHPRARLMLVGGGYAGDRDERVDQALLSRRDIVNVGRSDDLAPYYSRMAVLAFPSYREGFPNVPLEAACAGVPTVGYRSTGTVDAVEDGVTGRLVPKREIGALANAIVSYLARPNLRVRHGQAARSRAIEKYSQEVVWRSWAAFYRAELDRASIASLAGG